MLFEEEEEISVDMCQREGLARLMFLTLGEKKPEAKTTIEAT